MNFGKGLVQGVTRSVGRKVLASKKNSPHIFFVGGVIGVVGAGVLACRATLKLEETLDEIKRDIDHVKEASVNAQRKEDVMRHAGYVTGKSVLAIGRLYGPAIVVGGISIAALTGSHIQLSRRNAALSSTLALVTKAYDDYRQKVREEIGKEREEELYYDVQPKTVDVDGKKKEIKASKTSGCSPYAQFFDEFNPNWQNNSELNRAFLECQQNWVNHQLQARGYVFLNDVYLALGMERTSAGQIVGWVLNGEKSDNYIDFGLYEKRNEAFMQGAERAILLDFNVDGPMYEDI